LACRSGRIRLSLATDTDQLIEAWVDSCPFDFALRARRMVVVVDELTPVASTALWMAAERARESVRPDRLFDDPLAERLAGPEGLRIMAEMRAGLPENPAIPIRTRYFDDRLLDVVGAGRIRQVVLVAAGMDTRAFRLGLPADVVVFELDQPGLLDLKERRLDAAEASCERRSVGVDLRRPWSRDLVSAGFTAGEPAVFVAEGLLGYLPEPDVHELLDALARLASAGSVLLADVSGRTPDDVPYLATWFARLEKAGLRRQFATDDPEGLFASHGWEAQVIEYGEEGANFGRWPWPPVDRRDPTWPHNYLVSALRR
jgi:methyltransferase (TIGR00027 family)